MALFFVNMPCPLCNEPIRVGDDIVATTHFIGNERDPLYRYSDSVMHRSCFDRWECRYDFTNEYRNTMTAIYPGDSHYATWPGVAGQNIVKEPPPPPPPAPPKHFCPKCNAGLSVAQQGECASCGWLRYPSDRSQWERAGSCPSCRFSYRFDGSRCSHCGWPAKTIT